MSLIPTSRSAGAPTTQPLKLLLLANVSTQHNGSRAARLPSPKFHNAFRRTPDWATYAIQIWRVGTESCFVFRAQTRTTLQDQSAGYKGIHDNRPGLSRFEALTKKGAKLDYHYRTRSSARLVFITDYAILQPPCPPWVRNYPGLQLSTWCFVAGQHMVWQHMVRSQ